MTASVEKTSPRRRRFGRLTRFLVVVAALMLGLLVGEMAVRMLGLAPGLRRISLSDPDSVYQKSDNPLLTFEMKASYQAEDPDSYLNYPRTNAHGQRDVERTLEKPAGTHRAILLGDSVVEGFGLREIDDTISRQMEKLLADRNWEVLNFGVSGYCTLAEVELLKTKGVEFSPDVVLLVFVQNDFENYNQDNAGVTQGERPSWIVRSLLANSHLFRYGFAMLDLRGGAQAISSNNVVEGLQEFANLAQHHQFQPAIAVWPQFENKGITDVQPMPNGQGDLIIERLARMHGIPVVRMSDVFRAHMEASGATANPRVRYTVEGDGMHATVEAAQIAARALTGVVEDIWLESDEGRVAFRPKSGVDTEAVIAADNVSQDDPDNVQRYSNQANLYARKGQPEMAAAYYESALEVDADSPDVHTNYGKVLVQLERRDEARTHLEKAVALAPEHAFALTNLGVFLISEAEFAAAAGHLRKAIELEPSRADSHFHLGRAVLREAPRAAENLAEAAAHYERAIAINPEMIVARYSRALVLESQGKLAAAVEEYRQVLQANPENASAANNLAWILATAADATLRNGVGAVRHAETAARLTENGDPSMLDTLAAAYAEAGRFAEAIETATRALELVDGDSSPIGDGLRQRLRLYQAGKAYRQESAGPDAT